MSDHAACDVKKVGLARNGKPRHWCVAHRAPANLRGEHGSLTCEHAGRAVIVGPSISIDPTDYTGGIAIWGSVSAIFDTTGLPPERGVHVHARRSEAEDKEIDDTFHTVTFSYQRTLFESTIVTIGQEEAVAFYLARFAGREICCLLCPTCGASHTDTDAFAITPHQKHLCHSCGRFFSDDKRGVSNPLALIAGSLSNSDQAEPRVSPKVLEITQAEFPGGLQLWASNPAIVWLADRPEEAGIHVHAYNADGRRDLDDTYGSVTIDGVHIDNEQAGYLMAQQTASAVRNRIVSLTCSACGEAQLDRGPAAFQPRTERSCDCGTDLSGAFGRRLVVANPLSAVLESLQAARPRGIDEGVRLHHGHWH